MGRECLEGLTGEGRACEFEGTVRTESKGVGVVCQVERRYIHCCNAERTVAFASRVPLSRFSEFVLSRLMLFLVPMPYQGTTCLLCCLGQCGCRGSPNELPKPGKNELALLHAAMCHNIRTLVCSSRI